MYDFQKDYVTGLVEAIRTGYDIFDEKSRDMGVSWLALAVRFWLWLSEDGYQGLLGSRKEDYVDNGTLDSLYGKLDYFITHIKDPLVLPKGFDVAKHRTYMRLINPENGNVLKGESSNKNFSRGGRYKDVFFDEFGFWPDARNSWTAAGDATRCRHAVTTPPDEPTFAKSLRFSDKVKVRTWHWTLHPRKDAAWYKYEQSRRTEEEVLHELDISWEYSSTGRPYPEISQVAFGQYEYDKEMPLYMSIDLGLDAVALGWYQPLKNSDWVNMVDAYEASDKIIEWYFPFFGLSDCVNVSQCSYCGKTHSFDYSDKDLAAMQKVQHFKRAIFFGDPSGKQRHVESGVAPYTILEEHGIEVQINEQENNWTSRRDATKRLFTHMTVNDTQGTRWWSECIKNAHYPKREETSQAITPLTKPVHDWTSHHRTQTEYFSVNYKSDYGISDEPRMVQVPAKQGFYVAPSGEPVGLGLNIQKILKDANRRHR